MMPPLGQWPGAVGPNGPNGGMGGYPMYLPPPFYGVPPGAPGQQQLGYNGQQYVYDPSSGTALPPGGFFDMRYGGPNQPGFPSAAAAGGGAAADVSGENGNMKRTNTTEEFDRLAMMDPSPYFSMGNLSQADFDLLRSSQGNLFGLAGSSNTLTEGSHDALAAMYGSIRNFNSVASFGNLASNYGKATNSTNPKFDPLASMYADVASTKIGSDVKHASSAPSGIGLTSGNSSGGIDTTALSGGGSKSVSDLTRAGKEYTQHKAVSAAVVGDGAGPAVNKDSESGDNIEDAPGKRVVTDSLPISAISGAKQSVGSVNQSVSLLSLVSETGGARLEDLVNAAVASPIAADSTNNASGENGIIEAAATTEAAGTAPKTRGTAQTSV